MSAFNKENAKTAAKVAVQAARVMLIAAEDIPTFGSVAKLINKIIQICDQCKCNKGASQALQERFCRLSEHLFSGPQGLAAIASSRPNNVSLAVFCGRMEIILQNGVTELERFTKGGFIMSILKGSKPQRTFENLDNDMTECLNELSTALHVTALNEQAKIYDVVCDIQAKVDQRGGLEGLMADPAQLESLAQEIGADVDDLKTEVLHVLASLGSQVSVVDENVREMKANVDAVHQAVVKMQKAASAPDLSSLRLTSNPVLDRSQVLGEGGFGKVYKGVYNHIEVAVKEVNVTAAQEKEFLREVAMHHKVGNLPGVVRIFGANLTAQPRYIVLELAAGTLHDTLHKGIPEIDRTLPSKLSILAQVCSTMAAISDMGILHRDLKSSNVLLFFNNARVYAKISDFGLTKMANESTIGGAGATPKGTLPYMAPELFRGHYSSGSDMYAFAVLLNEVLTEQVPFPGRSYVEIVQAVGTFGERPDRYKADVEDALGCELMRFTESCWHQDPALRMSFHELAAELNHLLRKAAEAARVGNQASALTPPRPPTGDINSSISTLSDWLTSNCHLSGSDARRLAHTLVTVKQVESTMVLSQLVQRTPDFLTKDMKVSAVHEINILAALGVNAKSSQVSSVKLESLNNTELCQLFDHCSLSEYSGFITQNKLKGVHLHDAVDSVQDLVDLGLDTMTSKVVFKRIVLWKEKGLPLDFNPALSTSPSSFPTSYAAVVADQAVTSEFVGPSDKQLDDDFYSARYLRSRAATDRIIAAAEKGNHLAEAYLSTLFGRVNTLVDKSFDKATSYAEMSLPWLKHSASSGNMYALHNLALCYYDGRGVTKDEKEATSFFQLAAKQGHREALYVLGVCYANGNGVSKDETEAARNLKLAADQGQSSAQYSIGLCYIKGAGVTKDEKEAVRYSMLAAAQGHAGGQYVAGACYDSGSGVVRDRKEALRLFKLAADQGEADAQRKIGWYYASGIEVLKDETEAVRYYKLAADQGLADTQCNVGIYYQNGIGVAKDEKEAVKYYKLSADQGFAVAQKCLGLCYKGGTGVSKDEKEAARYFKLAADQGLAEAQYFLGVSFNYGLGVTQDKKEAFRYDKLAADQGFPRAQLSVGVSYSLGSVVAKDEKEAVRYYRLAADQSLASAQYLLGKCYANGSEVTKDEKEAASYIKMAADQGLEDAQYDLGVRYSNGVGVAKDINAANRYYKLAADQGHAQAKSALTLKTGFFKSVFGR